jgi:hypothetical protein
LDGRDYLFTFLWNQREARWYFNLLDEENVLIAASVKVICDIALLRFYEFDPRTPPGVLIAMDLTDDNSPPGFDELGIGRRVELTYYPATEL